MNREKLYDLIYNKADKLMKEHNPCNIHKDKRGRCRCSMGVTCCNNCQHIGFFGCVIENAMCRAFLCYKERKKYPVLGKKLGKLERILCKYKLHAYYITKEQLFEVKKIKKLQKV